MVVIIVILIVIIIIITIVIIIIKYYNYIINDLKLPLGRCLSQLSEVAGCFYPKLSDNNINYITYNNDNIYIIIIIKKGIWERILL